MFSANPDHHHHSRQQLKNVASQQRFVKASVQGAP